MGSSHDTSGFSSLASSDPETKQKWYESGVGFLQKQERSGSGAAAEDEDLRSSKLPKTYDDLSSSSSSTKGLLFPHRQVASLLRSNSPFFLSDSNQHPHQMLCFSSPKTDPFPPDKTSSLSRVSPNFYHSSAPRNAGTFYLLLLSQFPRCFFGSFTPTSPSLSVPPKKFETFFYLLGLPSFNLFSPH